MPNAAQRFPFPGEAPEKPAAATPAGKPAVPDAPAAATGKSAAGKSAAAAFPYPGDAEPAATPVKPGASPGSPPAYPGDPDAAKGVPDGFSSSSSSSGSSSDSADPDATPLADAGSSGDGTKADRSKRRKLPKVEAQSPEEREAEDLEVAAFYTRTGNLQGAYARAKDAVQISPTDPAAHLAWADLAQKLGKADEARDHYGKVLTLDPDDKQQRIAKHALVELGPVPAGK